MLCLSLVYEVRRYKFFTAPSSGACPRQISKEIKCSRKKRTAARTTHSHCGRVWWMQYQLGAEDALESHANSSAAYKYSLPSSAVRENLTAFYEVSIQRSNCHALDNMSKTASIIAFASVNWSGTGLILLLGIAAIITFQRLGRFPIVQHNSTLLIKGWPLVGCVEFFNRRAEFLVSGFRLSQDGHFRFRYGMHLIIALSGADARTSYFSTRGLDPLSGCVSLVRRPVSLLQEFDQVADTLLCSQVSRVRTIWKAGG